MIAFKIYWSAYGGVKALLRSPYLWASCLISVALIGIWFPVNDEGQRDWSSLALSVLPGLISFSIGALAIMFSMTSGVFVKVLHNGQDDSLYMKTVATFFHFILVQCLALLWVLALEAYDCLWISAVAFWLFTYSILCGLAAAANTVLLADLKNKSTVLDADERGL